MHRGMGDILAELPAYIYNIWLYKNSKLTSANRHALHHFDIPFDASYRQGNVKIQRLSIMPRVPQIEGLFVPSPDVDPHKNALIKLLLFKPLHAEAEIDEQGNPTDPYEQLYISTDPAPGSTTKETQTRIRMMPLLTLGATIGSTRFCRTHVQPMRS